jgi:protein O-mannosyl-transferase
MNSDPVVPSPRSKGNLILMAVLLIATCLAYLPTLWCGFIWDDDAYVEQNLTLRDWSGLFSIWFETSATPQYYPLVHSSFWIEYQMWGLNPVGFHITNILIHAVNAILLWKVLSRLDVPGAWVAALIFAVHPVHVESVAWITERKNVLSGMFYLLSLLSILRFWHFTRPCKETLDGLASESRDWKWLVPAYVCFVAALLCKTVTATLPAVILVLIWWKRGRLRLTELLCLCPMFALGIIFGLLTVSLETTQVGAAGVDWDLSFWDRSLIAGRAITFYAEKVFWPTNLMFIYPRWQIDSKDLSQWIFPVAVLALMLALWLTRNRIGRGPLAAVLLFAGTLFPALGFFNVYPFRFSFVADHFQYLASIAMIVLGTSLVTIWAKRVFEENLQLMKFASASIAAMLMLLTALQTQIYKDRETLWRDTLRKNPECFLAHNNLGAMLTRRGDIPEAEKHIREALRIKPDFTDSVVNMARVLEVQGDFDGALKYYQEAEKQSPFYAPALNGLGAIYGTKGDMRSAEEYFRLAIRSDPKHAQARINLASILQAQADPGAAVKELELAYQYQPDSRPVQDKLLEAYVKQENFRAASDLLETMLVRSPDDLTLLGTTGMMMAKQKRFPEAIEYFQRVLELEPNLPEALLSLAEAYEAQGDKEKSKQYRKEFEKHRKDGPR